MDWVHEWDRVYEALTTASIGDSQSTQEVDKIFRFGVGSCSQMSMEQDTTHRDGGR